MSMFLRSGMFLTQGRYAFQLNMFFLSAILFTLNRYTFQFKHA
jgi:hypothetical protein